MGSNKNTPKFIGSNRGALELGSSILPRVKSPKAKLFLELFKSYFSLILILGSS